MINFHRKGDDVPKEWYEITKGKIENPFFIFRFSQDCESMVISGTRNILTVSGTGLFSEIFNANNMNINFLAGGLNFIKPRLQYKLNFNKRLINHENRYIQHRPKIQPDNCRSPLEIWQQRPQRRQIWIARLQQYDRCRFKSNARVGLV